MKKIIVLVSALLAAAVFVVPTKSAFADSPYYKFQRVIDGDTIKVVSAQTSKVITVRLACIDAPEKGQAGYEFSKQMLEKLLTANPTLEIRTDLKTKDRYGRLIAEIYYEKDSQFFLLNQQLIADGAAMYYEKYAKSGCGENAALYKHTQAQAIKSQIGIWSPPAFPPIMPEVFRKLSPIIKDLK